MSAVDIADVDDASLVMLAGSAIEEHVLRRLSEAGFERVRTVHGYVIQRLLDGPTTVGDIAAQLQITQQRASTIVSDLESAGCLERTPRADDGRVKDLSLTEAGHQVVAVARAARAELNQVLDHGADLRAGLLALLQFTNGLDAIRRRAVPIRA